MYPYQNPNYYYYQPQMYPYFQRMPKKFNLQHTLHTTIRGIQIANQVIPIIYQNGHHTSHNYENNLLKEKV